jgi:maltose alpha-D-glucosyltransferase / alpha-amylase
LVRLWKERTRTAFLEGYREGVDGAVSYPDEEHARALIELFTLERALHEIRYELDNRPAWVSIPIRAVLDLLLKRDDGEGP